MNNEVKQNPYRRELTSPYGLTTNIWNIHYHAECVRNWTWCRTWSIKM